MIDYNDRIRQMHRRNARRHLWKRIGNNSAYTIIMVVLVYVTIHAILGASA